VDPLQEKGIILHRITVHANPRFAFRPSTVLSVPITGEARPTYLAVEGQSRGIRR